MEENKLFESEHRFLELVWEFEPINSTEISKVAEERLGWKKSTTYNMIRKLSEKKLIVNEDAMVRSLVKKSRIQQLQIEEFLEKNFEGSLKSFLKSALKDKELTKEEGKSLKKIITRQMP